VRTYLDHNATSPLRPAVKAAMIQALDLGGNASSIHAEGRAAHKLADDAREALAFALGCLPQMIVFTGSGSEANNTALRGVGAERTLVSAIEHPSVLAAAKASGKPVERIPVTGEGIVDVIALEQMITGPNVLVSVMLANNETGVIQPVTDVVRIAKAKGALVHVDAVQGFGKIPVNFGLWGCDMMTVAAHKVGGPVGVGALVVRDGLVVEPLIVGGGQELRRRAGTENLAAIAGFAATAKEGLLQTTQLRLDLEEALLDATVIGAGADRLPNTTCFAMPGMNAESLVMNFDLEGVAVSSGSACSSGKVSRSHVLEAMGLDANMSSAAVRVSLGWSSTQAEVEHFSTVWNKLLQRHMARRAA
jgi:cysteine desulfurase